MEQTTVAIIHSSPLYSRAIGVLCEQEKDIRTVFHTTDVGEGIRRTGGHKPDVIILECPGACTASNLGHIATDIQTISPKSHILILVSDKSSEVIKAGAEAEIRDFVDDRSDNGYFLSALRKTSEGIGFLCPLCSNQALESTRHVQDLLSSRETEILQMLSYGHTTASIAHTLHLSPRTVESHRASLIEKLGAESRVDLVRAALERGLLVP